MAGLIVTYLGKGNNIIDYDSVLKGWHSLSPLLSSATDVSWCIDLLLYERNNAQRSFIIQRIKSRIINIITSDVRRELDEY